TSTAFTTYWYAASPPAAVISPSRIWPESRLGTWNTGTAPLRALSGESTYVRPAPTMRSARLRKSRSPTTADAERCSGDISSSAWRMFGAPTPGGSPFVVPFFAGALMGFADGCLLRLYLRLAQPGRAQLGAPLRRCCQLTATGIDHASGRLHQLDI